VQVVRNAADSDVTAQLLAVQDAENEFSIPVLAQDRQTLRLDPHLLVLRRVLQTEETFLKSWKNERFCVRELIFLLQMPSVTLYRAALFRTDVSKNISSPSSKFLGVIGFHSCVTVEITPWGLLSLIETNTRSRKIIFLESTSAAGA
jgi:hypothetical protein